MDHSADPDSLMLMILMELGACDLHSFLGKSLEDLGVPDITRLWRSLVASVDAAHSQGTYKKCFQSATPHLPGWRETDAHSSLDVATYNMHFRTYISRSGWRDSGSMQCLVFRSMCGKMIPKLLTAI